LTGAKTNKSNIFSPLKFWYADKILR
jgi:hypothetical protein